MPEGDTLYRVARTLHKALANQVIRRFDSAYAPLLRIDEEAPLVGRTVQRVEARGKWCLIWIGPRPEVVSESGTEPTAPATSVRRWDGTLILCSHLRMNGMWHIYRAGPTPDRDEKWQRPARDMRVFLANDTFVAVGFRVPVAELLTVEELARYPELGRLGPDLLSPQFDADEARRRLRARGDYELGEALLDQSAMAGLGNVYKSEVCFLCGLNPFSPVRTVPDETLNKVMTVSQRLLRENIYNPGASGVITFTGLRRTTSAMSPGDRLWVYGRDGEPCRRCSTPILQARQGPNARVTFHCPNCQPAATS
jgi:endonuclease-8